MAAETENLSVIDRLLAHNLWGTRRLLEHCRTLTPQQFMRNFEIGPGNLHDTLLHVAGAMWRWADRIGDRELRPSIEDSDRRYTPQEIIATLDEAAGDLAGVVRRVAQEGRLDEKMQFHVRGYAEPFVVTRGSAIVHVVTHGVHHRAQVLNMMRQLGMKDLPDLDALEWELEEAAPAGGGQGG